MAEFCKACAIEFAEIDYGDLAHITSKKDEKEGKYVVVICEGCGVIQVDHKGNCVSKDCLKKGEEGHGVKKSV